MREGGGSVSHPEELTSVESGVGQRFPETEPREDERIGLFVLYCRIEGFNGPRLQWINSSSVNPSALRLAATSPFSSCSERMDLRRLAAQSACAGRRYGPLLEGRSSGALRRFRIILPWGTGLRFALLARASPQASGKGTELSNRLTRQLAKARHAETRAGKRRQTLSILGAAARWGRAMGLTPVLDAIVDILDTAFMKLGRPPLRQRIGNLEIYGYLRHRSFLASLEDDYEGFARDLFTENLRSGVTVLDGGAHVGYYTLLAASFVGVTVYAVEPDPYNAAALRFNVAKNGFKDRVEVVTVALADADGITAFFQGRSTIGSSIGQRSEHGKGRRLEVPSATVDRLLENAEVENLLIKLDLEGAEARALRGMRETLRRSASVVLLMEVNPPALRSAGDTPGTLYAELHRLSFEALKIDERSRSVQAVDPEEMSFKGNLYCQKVSQLS